MATLQERLHDLTDVESRPSSAATAQDQTTMEPSTEKERGKERQRHLEIEREEIHQDGDEELATGPKDEGQQTSVVENTDPNAVNWDGPDDPENPMNYPAKKKWIKLIAMAVMTLLVPLGSSMFAPGVPDITKQFHSHNDTIATFVVSVYILGFAFGPLLAAPLSEVYGRAICYNVSNVLFLIFTIVTALSQNMAMLIVFRFLMGLAGATAITNGSGTISDMFPVQERGKALSVWFMGPLLGPSIGPMAGGFIVECLGWRWAFWIIAMAVGVVGIISYFLVTETYHLTILQRKTRRLRKETGNQDLYCALEGKNQRHTFKLAIVRPVKMLLMIPSVAMVSLYIAVEYGILYLLFSTYAFVFPETYGFGPDPVGLAFIPVGIGMLSGTLVAGSFTDVAVKKKIARGETPLPEDRISLLFLLPCGVCVAGSLFWYGWAAQSGVHWIVPMLGTAVFGFGLLGLVMCLQTYLIDCFVQYAASAAAAISILRSLGGALLPLAGLSMYLTLNLGWGNSLLGFISLALVPILLVFRFYGANIRARTNVRL